MPVAFALTRHGQYEQPADVPSAHLPHPLTAEGRAQAQAAGHKLRAQADENGWVIDSVIDSSPLLRAWETASILADILGATVEMFDELTERSLGAAANLTMAEIERVVERDPRFEALEPGWKRQSHFRLPLVGAESLVMAGERVSAHLQKRHSELRQLSSPDVVSIRIVVGHGGSLRHGAAAMGWLKLEDLALLSMHHCRPVIYEATSSGWDKIAGDWKSREPTSWSDSSD